MTNWTDNLPVYGAVLSTITIIIVIYVNIIARLPRVNVDMIEGMLEPREVLIYGTPRSIPVMRFQAVNKSEEEINLVAWSLRIGDKDFPMLANEIGEPFPFEISDRFPKKIGKGDMCTVQIHTDKFVAFLKRNQFVGRIKIVATFQDSLKRKYRNRPCTVQI